MIPAILGRRGAATALGYASFLLIGWSGLLVPALIRQVEHDFGQTDAGLGLFYFVFAVAYVAGSLGGGLLTERFGRRTVLTVSALLHGLGLIAQLSPSWVVFMIAAIPRGLGTGSIDGGINGLFLDLFPDNRGRALSAVHLFFSLGALAAPFAAGVLVDSGVPWQAIVLATGLVSFPIAVLLAIVPMPSGHHAAPEGTARPRLGLALPLLILAVAISFYVASEVGVSSWLVRFLEDAPLTVATLGLTLYWAGLTAGRLVSARIADRFDHGAFAIASLIAMSVAILLAVAVPSVPLSIAFFTLAGFASGPVYPMIIAIGGERFPARAAAVSGFLGAAAVFGSVVYPPVMGFLSITVGLAAAMIGTAVLGFASAGALLAPLARRSQDAASADAVSSADQAR